MNNVFITGATSFIGVNLIKELEKSNYNITAIIRKNSKKRKLLSKFQDINIIEIDIEEINKLPSLIDYKCDVFYHLAWNGTRGSSRNDEELQKSNYEYSIDTLKIAKEMGCKIFISAGSQAEYGIHNDIVSEATIENPVTQYGIYKLKFCNYAKDYCIKNNIRFIEPRFFSLYGPNDFENTLVISSINKLLNNEELNLTKCIQLWNFLYIDDAVSALVKLQNSDNEGVYVFGSDDTRTLKDFIDEMYVLTNSKSKINYGTVEYGKEGIVNVNPTIEKIKSSINWKPEFEFKDGIKEIIRMKKD